jgi:hypothetical protein
MKQSKGSKQLKEVRLSDPTGVRDVALGHKATAERSPRNYSKSDVTQMSGDDNDFDDVAARRQRFGITW